VYVWQALKLNDFNIVTMVGAGSFGQVFQVRKKDTNQVFALKVLDKSHLRKIDQVQNTKQVLCLLLFLVIMTLPRCRCLYVSLSMSLPPCLSFHVSPFIQSSFPTPHVSLSTCLSFVSLHPCLSLHPSVSMSVFPPPSPSMYLFVFLVCTCVLLSHTLSRLLPRFLAISPAFSRVLSLCTHAHTHTIQRHTHKNRSGGFLR